MDATGEGSLAIAADDDDVHVLPAGRFRERGLFGLNTSAFFEERALSARGGQPVGPANVAATADGVPPVRPARAILS